MRILLTMRRSHETISKTVTFAAGLDRILGEPLDSLYAVSVNGR